MSHQVDFEFSIPFDFARCFVVFFLMMSRSPCLIPRHSFHGKRASQMYGQLWWQWVTRVLQSVAPDPVINGVFWAPITWPEQMGKWGEITPFCVEIFHPTYNW